MDAGCKPTDAEFFRAAVSIDRTFERERKTLRRKPTAREVILAEPSPR